MARLRLRSLGDSPVGADLIPCFRIISKRSALELTSLVRRLRRIRAKCSSIILRHGRLSVLAHRVFAGDFNLGADPPSQGLQNPHTLSLVTPGLVIKDNLAASGGPCHRVY